MDPEENATSSENNTSTILLFNFEGDKQIYTADAGTPALEKAINYLENKKLGVDGFSFIQAPHHGSKRNIGPNVLNKLIGYPIQENTNRKFTVFVSAAKEGEPKHPNKRVVNAFIRRGGRVVATQGSKKRHYANGMPTRENWSTAEPLPFYHNVEAEDDI